MEGFPLGGPSFEEGNIFGLEDELQVAYPTMSDAIYNDAEQRPGQLAQEPSPQPSVESPMIVEESGDVTMGSFPSLPPPLPSLEGWCRWREFISHYTGDFTREEPFCMFYQS